MNIDDFYIALDENSKRLQHHGVMGMKWGVRRYQNEDGTWKGGVKSSDRTTKNNKQHKGKTNDIKKPPTHSSNSVSKVNKNRTAQDIEADWSKAFHSGDTEAVKRYEAEMDSFLMKERARKNENVKALKNDSRIKDHVKTYNTAIRGSDKWFDARDKIYQHADRNGIELPDYAQKGSDYRLIADPFTGERDYDLENASAIYYKRKR